MRRYEMRRRVRRRRRRKRRNSKIFKNVGGLRRC
jgi:hypothetical protein